MLGPCKRDLCIPRKTIEAASLGAQVFSIEGGRSPSFAPPKHQKRTTGFSLSSMECRRGNQATGDDQSYHSTPVSPANYPNSDTDRALALIAVSDVSPAMMYGYLKMGNVILHFFLIKFVSLPCLQSVLALSTTHLCIIALRWHVFLSTVVIRISPASSIRDVHSSEKPNKG